MSQEQPNNPLHGMTLKAILTYLVEKYGWERLSQEVRIRCFQYDPDLKSSLKFLRRTPWAREKLELFYLKDHKQVQKNKARNKRRAARRKYTAEQEALQQPKDTSTTNDQNSSQ